MQELSEEKKQWLKSIGAGEFHVPVKFIYTFDHIFNTNTGSNWFLDMGYVKNTALEELQAQYEENKRYFESTYVNKTAPEVPVQEKYKYEVLKEYKTKLENGTNLIVSIDLQLNNFEKEDFQEILSKFAMDSHSFYLYIAENIISKNCEVKDLEKEKTLRELEEQFTKKDTPKNRMDILGNINKRKKEIETKIVKTLNQECLTVNESISILRNIENFIMNSQIIIKD